MRKPRGADIWSLEEPKSPEGKFTAVSQYGRYPLPASGCSVGLVVDSLNRNRVGPGETKKAVDAWVKLLIEFHSFVEAGMSTLHTAGTLCRGTGRGDEPTNCRVLLPARCGVLQPRCPRCFAKHLEMLKEARASAVVQKKRRKT